MTPRHFNLGAILQIREIVGGCGIIKHPLENVGAFTRMGGLNIRAKAGNNYRNVKCICLLCVWKAQ